MGRGLKSLDNRKTNSFTFEYPINDPQARKILEDFYKILVREGWDLKEGMKQAIELYVERHGPGNYQTLMNSFQPKGHRSEGQLEQELVRYFQGLERDITGREILAKIKKELGYDSKRAAATLDRIGQQLHELGVRIWR
jgi:hypothetical protein